MSNFASTDAKRFTLVWGPLEEQFREDLGNTNEMVADLCATVTLYDREVGEDDVAHGMDYRDDLGGAVAADEITIDADLDEDEASDLVTNPATWNTVEDRILTRRGLTRGDVDIINPEG